jgi:hypothetical protein
MGSPNGGVLTEAGALGINVDGNNGFDISYIYVIATINCSK